jgi:hypothetical protein
MTAAIAPADRLFSFVAGSAGQWRIDAMRCVAGEVLACAPMLSIIAGQTAEPPAASAWLLRGITSNERYVLREEKVALVSKQEGLGRARSSRAALIPIRKNAAWWALAHDECRAIFENQSAHIAIGMKFLPAIARRLHHCRDLGTGEPFDFLTWFEYAPGTRLRSKTWSSCCAHLRNGLTLSAKSTSASAGHCHETPTENMKGSPWNS